MLEDFTAVGIECWMMDEWIVWRGAAACMVPFGKLE